MMKLKSLTGSLRLMSMMLALTFVLSGIVPLLTASAARAEGGTWQDLVLLYTTDIKGKIEPCG
jgi:uncharacterized membrane protein HdeD (DUF308 family)